MKNSKKTTKAVKEMDRGRLVYVEAGGILPQDGAETTRMYPESVLGPVPGWLSCLSLFFGLLKGSGSNPCYSQTFSGHFLDISFPVFFECCPRKTLKTHPRGCLALLLVEFCDGKGILAGFSKMVGSLTKKTPKIPKL